MQLLPFSATVDARHPIPAVFYWSYVVAIKRISLSPFEPPTSCIDITENRLFCKKIPRRVTISCKPCIPRRRLRNWTQFDGIEQRPEHMPATSAVGWRGGGEHIKHLLFTPKRIFL